ncbi:hypothetical protein F4820DRAFT_141522 [Hypoxylon rubiginosum]|uniref:Uncharacterized protein n=1 Tax=Hypoxylon rubiginosum TaxID=110542 RepID=A0ACB9YKW4_9PEZI|nr:hypothetical protein F4820DRAFT_141522 [Hypoxylon rubiginosum]
MAFWLSDSSFFFFVFLLDQTPAYSSDSQPKLMLSIISTRDLIPRILVTERYFTNHTFLRVLLHTFTRVQRFLEATREALCPIRSRSITIHNTCHYDFL